ncbi:MAG: class I SAM-dependent methyltransferase [Dehalococcoidia bacterium]
MYWDKEYESCERVWGEGPSELAKAAVRFLQEYAPKADVLNILDIGCGYGRDAFYFSDNCSCSILGIDISGKAIDIASKAALKTPEGDMEFRCCNFTELTEGNYDMVVVSNLYQVLKQDEREELREAVTRTLKLSGLLFLSTLSIRDPEHSGKGIPVPDEPGSFIDKRYVHLCTREELIEDFAFLDIEELYEHEYYEPRANGEVHHHISWILIGEHAGALRRSLP